MDESRAAAIDAIKYRINQLITESNEYFQKFKTYHAPVEVLQHALDKCKKSNKKYILWLPIKTHFEVLEELNFVCSNEQKAL